jgi:hypothetical protein
MYRILFILMDNQIKKCLELIADSCIDHINSSEIKYEKVILHGADIGNLNYMQNYFFNSNPHIKKGVSIKVDEHYHYRKCGKEGIYSLDVGALLGTKLGV